MACKITFHFPSSALRRPKKLWLKFKLMNYESLAAFYVCTFDLLINTHCQFYSRQGKASFLAINCFRLIISFFV